MWRRRESDLPWEWREMAFPRNWLKGFTPMMLRVTTTRGANGPPVALLPIRVTMRRAPEGMGGGGRWGGGINEKAPQEEGYGARQPRSGDGLSHARQPSDANYDTPVRSIRLFLRLSGYGKIRWRTACTARVLFVRPQNEHPKASSSPTFDDHAASVMLHKFS